MISFGGGEGFEFFSGKFILHNETSFVYSIAVNEYSNLLAFGLFDNSVILRYLDSFEEYFRDTNSHEFYIWSLIFSDDGNYLFSGDSHGNIIKWDVKKKEMIQKFKPHSNIIRHFRIFENNLISSCANGYFVSTDVDTLKEKSRQYVNNFCKLLLNEPKHDFLIGKYNGYIGLLESTNNTRNICISIIFFIE
jgi:WD40 repeat protein